MNLKIVAATLGAFFVSSQAMALVSAGAFLGQRSGELKNGSKSETVQSMPDISLTVTVDPIPLIPVGFGLTINSNNYDVSTAKHGVSEFPGLMIIPEIKGWLPMVPVVTPYAKLGYIIGSYKPKTEIDIGIGQPALEVDGVYETSGTSIGIGVEYGLVPLIGLALEVNLTQQKMKPKELEYTDPNTGTKIDLADDAKEEDFNTTAILLGVTVGI